MVSFDPGADTDTGQEFESSVACLQFIFGNLNMQIRIKFLKGSVSALKQRRK